MLPRTPTEQRNRFYEDVDALLSPGFLTHSVVVGGVRLNMRSLGTGDLFMLNARTAGVSMYEWRVWAVATAIWMVNGRTVLGHDNAIPFLAEYVRQLPVPVLEILFSILLGLWVRVGDAVGAVEVYNYETNSRYRWKSIGSAGLLHSGVPGAATLGLNAIQRIWVAFNEMEDTKRQEETAWEGFKLVASSNAPKAIAKMDKKDQQRRGDESKDRQGRLDRYFYEQVGVLKPKGEAQGDGSTHRIEGSKSVEDLEEEMRRWVTDDQDLHDRVVAEYKARILAQHEQARQEREARRAALQKKREELEWETGEFKPRPLMAVTGEQLQAMLAQRGPGSKVAFLPQAPATEGVRNRYGIKPSTGNLQVQEGRVVNPNAEADTDQRTLGELIKGRSPAFGAGE